MQDLIIYGAGGFGRETALMIGQINAVESQWNILGFYDDGIKQGSIVDGLPVLGDLNDLNNYKKPLAVALAVANPTVRKKIKSTIVNPKINFPALIHPTVIRGDLMRNRFGDGSIISAGTILTTHVLIQDFVILNLACTIGHDVQIGKYCTLMPACHISGNVTIGDHVLIGTGASVLQDLKIENDSRIGAGAVVTKNVHAGVTVVGIPAKQKD